MDNKNLSKKFSSASKKILFFVKYSIFNANVTHIIMDMEMSIEWNPFNSLVRIKEQLSTSHLFPHFESGKRMFLERIKLDVHTKMLTEGMILFCLYYYYFQWTLFTVHGHVQDNNINNNKRMVEACHLICVSIHVQILIFFPSIEWKSHSLSGFLLF